MKKLTKAELERFVVYESGRFYWKPRNDPAFNGRFAGEPVICQCREDGYLGGLVGGVRLLMHQAVWLMETGEWPEKQIDHIDGNRRNNRFENLRLASNAQNSRNSRARKGSSAYKGVYWRKDKSLWRVQLMIDGVRKEIGHFKSETEAALAYNAAAIEHFGEFARLNEIPHSVEEKARPNDNP